MRRARLALIAALLVPVAAGAAIAAPGTGAARAQDDGIALGIVLPNFFTQTDEIAPALEKARVRAVWRVVQPGCAAIRAGRYDWRRLDRQVGTFTGRGIPLLATIHGGPACAVEQLRDGRLLDPKPRYRDEFAAFARRVVARYGPESERGGAGGCCGITELEIWNEPNLAIKWREPDGAEFGRFLKLVASEVRRAPGAEGVRIVSGGITTNTATEFLRSLYRVPGVKRSFDAVGLHTYSPNSARVLRRTAAVRRRMNASGDRATPIAITEHGWATCAEPSSEFHGKCTTRAGQSQKLEGLLDGLAERPGLGVDTFLWYTPIDTGEPANERDCARQPKFFYGFFDRDGDPKPAWEVWRSRIGGELAPDALDPVPKSELDDCEKHD